MIGINKTEKSNKGNYADSIIPIINYIQNNLDVLKKNKK